jgi:membrane protease YdiL (CAAX protease family)
MKKSLKSQPPFIQLIILGSITLVFMFISSALLGPLILDRFNLTNEDFQKFDYSKPGFVSAMRVMVTVLSVGIFLLPAIAFAFSADRRPLAFLGYRKPVPYTFFIVALAAVICSIPFVSWLAELNQHMHFPASMKNLEDALRKSEEETNILEKNLLSMKSTNEMLLMVFLMGVVPAIVEETFFRGVLQRIFIESTTRPWAGIIITAIIFSAVHGQFLGFFPRAVLGVILGALYWFSGSIWTSILAHFVFNAMQVVLVYVNPKLVDTEPGFSAWVFAASAVLLVAVMWWMIKNSQTSYAEVYDHDDDFIIGPHDKYSA